MSRKLSQRVTYLTECNAMWHIFLLERTHLSEKYFLI